MTNVLVPQIEAIEPAIVAQPASPHALEIAWRGCAGGRAT
jgi:hypothetical protein